MKIKEGRKEGRKEVIVGKLGLGVAGESGSENGRGGQKQRSRCETFTPLNSTGTQDRR